MSNEYEKLPADTTRKFWGADIIKGFYYALDDPEVIFSEYWITRQILRDFLISKKPHINTAEKMAYFFNDYYIDYYYNSEDTYTPYEFEEMFDTRFLNWFDWYEWISKQSEDLLLRFSDEYWFSRFNRRGTIAWKLSLEDFDYNVEATNKILEDLYYKLSTDNNTFPDDDEDIFIESCDKLERGITYLN